MGQAQLLSTMTKGSTNNRYTWQKKGKVKYLYVLLIHYIMEAFTRPLGCDFVTQTQLFLTQNTKLSILTIESDNEKDKKPIM